MDSVALTLPSVGAVPGKEAPPLTTGSNYKEYHHLYKRFEAKEGQNTDADFESIWNWAKSQAPVDDPDSILWEVTKLAQRIGNPGYGEVPWSKILAWVTTYNQMNGAEKKLKEMENHGL